MKKRLLYTLLLPAILALACNFPAGAGTQSPTGTAIDLNATMTVISLVQTQTALAAIVQPVENPTATIQPTQQPTIAIPTVEVATRTASPQPKPCNAAKYVADITYDDGTQLAANTPFVKTWRLENVGTCTWTSGYQIIFDHGDQMNSPASLSMTSNSISPGMTVDVSVQLTSPASAGTYQGYFRLKAPDGSIFGINASAMDPFWVQIKVGAPTEIVSTKPDIDITKLSPCSAPKMGVPCTFTVQVYNDGGSATGNYSVKLYVGSAVDPKCEWNTSNNAGGGKVLTCEYIFPSWYGSITIKAIADANNDVNESNEANNAASKTFSVAK